MARQRTALLNDGEARTGRRVVAQHIQRVLAGMEPRCTCLDLAFVGVLLADFELEVAALQVLIKALIGGDDLYGLDFLG